MAASDPAIAEQLVPSPPRTAIRWADRWLDIRDRLLSSRRFRRWAASFPLTRPVARARTRALFDLCAGFVYSQVLFACVALGLFDMLAEGPQDRLVLARRLGLSPEAADRLLAAAVSLELASRRGPDRIGLGALGAAIVGNPGVVAMIRHHAILYRDLADPIGLLRGMPAETGLGRYWAYARAPRPADLPESDIADYTALMAVSQTMIAAEILDAYPIGRHRCLLDVGGGNGAFLTEAAARAPALGLILFDLPPVAERAGARLADSVFADRLRIVGGDFFSGALPREADVISLVRVLHDHDDGAALGLLRAVRAAIPPHGRLLIAEPMAGTRGAEPIGDAYFGFYLLAMGSGRPRTPREIAALLKAAGFAGSRLVATHTPLLVRLIVAKP
jgi:demethylspheroidene O-methyltransferase